MKNTGSSSSKKGGGKDDKNNNNNNTEAKGKKDGKKGAEVVIEDKKKGKKNTTEEVQQPAQPQPPKWTGKTPHQYLREFCQKQHIPRPEFHERSFNKKGEQFFHFSVSVTTEGKKKQMTTKQYTTHMTSTNRNEAMAYASLVALHDHFGNTNIHRLFEPLYTPYWTQLTEEANVRAIELKKEEEIRLAEEKLKEAQSKEPTHSQQIPSIVMSEEAIKTVHSLVRQMNIKLETSSDDVLTNEDQNQLSEKEVAIVTKSLEELGFKTTDINTAFTRVKDISNITNLITWLCLNVDQESLPVSFRPKSLGIQKLNTTTSPSPSSSSIPTKLQNTRSQLIEMGWLSSQVDQVLEDKQVKDVDEQEAFLKSIYLLSGLTIECNATVEEGEWKEQRDMEFEALKSIYTSTLEVIENTSDRSVCLGIKLENGSLKVLIPKWCKYPYQLPILLFTPNDKSWKKSFNYLICQELISDFNQMDGTPIIFNIIEKCLNINLNQLIEKSKQQKQQDNQNNSNSNNITNNTSLGNSHSNNNGSKVKPIKQNKGASFNHNMIKNNDIVNQELKELMEKNQKSPNATRVKKIRDSLPVFAKRQQFIEMLEKQQIIIVTGETGSGKSTQIPQYILEHCVEKQRGSRCNIICTQPRRISAIGVADRVAYEWSGGQDNTTGDFVGYQIRNESKRSKSTRLMFCTTGILLRMMVGEESSQLNGVSHVIVDEVHERSIDNDFLILILKQLAEKRKDLKIILMSATLDAELIASYFNVGTGNIFSVQGFTYPVKHIYLEESIKLINYKLPVKRSFRDQDEEDGNDYQDKVIEENESTTTTTTTTTNTTTTTTPEEPEIDPIQELMNNMGVGMEQKRINVDYIEKLILYLVTKEMAGKKKSILVFVPGLADILNICDRLKESPSIWALPLHSSLSPKDQQRVFDRAPDNQIKVVVATNIAETSITIDDISTVIDTGRSNQLNYNPYTKNSIMSESFISRAAIRQRAGRAGRTSAGTCYKLYTKEMEGKFDDQEAPEILRTPLLQLCLHVKLFQSGRASNSGDKIVDFLKQAIQPPSIDAIQAAIEELISVNAIQVDKTTGKELLTPMGYHLAQLPVDIYIGKMLLFGCIFRCIDPIITIAATLSYKTPFISGPDRQEKPQLKYAYGYQSDHFTFYTSYSLWRKAISEGKEYQFCRDNNLSISTLRTIQDLKMQFIEILSEIGFLPPNITSKSLLKVQKLNKGSEGIDELCGALFNSNSGNQKVIKSVLCIGMYPKITRIDVPAATYSKSGSGTIQNKYDPTTLKILTKREDELGKANNKLQRVFIHPRSINYQEGDYTSPFLVYHDKVQTSRLFIHHTTSISPITLLLFSMGGTLDIDTSFQHIILDKWLKFNASGKVLIMIKEIRLLLNELLDKKITDPSFDTSTSVVIDIILKIVKNEGYL